ncbi:hypothetical protein AB0L64_13620 [Kribbella sp. NPDC051936]|uniref:hypothetical protein n=1 Tax=Kribbella sp. NPDC051936 TaxID=3154946 RepID=UPI0034171250
MSEFIRDIVHAMKSIRTERIPPEMAAAPQPGRLVVLRVPGKEGGWGLVVNRLEELLSQQLTALMLDHDLDVQVRSTDRPGLEIAIDGRPVAVGIDPSLQANPAKLMATVDDRLRRRLSILLGPEPDPVSAYLVDHGFSVMRDSSTPSGLDPWMIEQSEIPDVSAEEIGERELAARPPRLRLEVAEHTLRRANPRPDAVISLRKALFAQKGVHFPDLELVPAAVPPGQVRLTANDVRVGPFELGEDAGWDDVVERPLRAFLLHHASWFVWNHDIKSAFEEVAFALPDMGATFLECYPRQYMLTACVRNFVREGRSVRNLARILWLLMEIGPAGIDSEKLSFSENPLLRDPTTVPNAQRDPAIVAARVRKCLAEEAWRVGLLLMPNPTRIPQHVESALLSAHDPAALAAAEWAAVDVAANYPRNATVVTSSVHAVALVHKALRALPHRLRVVAAQELPPGQRLDG